MKAALEFDCVVVGGGVFGAFTALSLRKKNLKVALIDQFHAAHNYGSSHGDGRIYRLAYDEDIYVDMMLQSLTKWHELEKEAGEKLMHKTGNVCISDKSPDKSFLTGLEKLYKRRNIDYVALSPAEVSQRFPQFRLSPGHWALTQAESGVLFASKCVKACWRALENLGASLFPNQRIIKLEKDGTGYLLVSDTGILFRTKFVVVAPGGWLSSVAKKFFGLSIPTTVTTETVSYYAPRKDSKVDHTYNCMPVFTTDFNNGIGAFGYYGLPQIDVPGIKLSAHYGGFVLEDIENRPKAAGGIKECNSALEEKAKKHISTIIEANNRFANTLFPHVESKPFKSETCIYTSTYDHDFVIDRVPGWDGVVLVGGGSGHGFKFGPAIGDCVSCLILNKPLPFPLEKFSLSRRSLYDPSLAAKGK